jgi:hypothetical protein
MKENMKYPIFIMIIFFVSSVDAAILNNPQTFTFGVDIIGDSFIVASSNVTIDLGGNVLAGAINGITVQPGLQNITIKNGIIANMFGNGILVNSGCSQIVISNITTYSCDNAGIEMLGSSSAPITDIFIDHCITLSCSGNSLAVNPASIYLNYCKAAQITNCTLNYNYNASNTITGILLENCKRSILEAILVRENQGLLGAVAFQFLNTEMSFMRDCIAIGNQTTSMIPGSYVYGYLISGFGSVNNGLINCFAIDQKNTDHSTGFFCDGGQSSIFFNECKALDNLGITDSYGFLITNTATRIEFLNCIAEHNTTSNVLTGTIAIGFSINNCDSCRFLSCIAGSNLASTAIGFDLNTSTRCVFRDCVASNNIGSLDSSSFGFRINQGLSSDVGGNIFVHNQAINNGIISNNQCNNFIVGTFNNINYSSLNSVLSPFTNLGVVP